MAIGGDGTAAEVAAGALAAGRPIPVGLVPRGTANILALNLGVPRSLRGALEAALGDVLAWIDVGRLDGRAFLLTASAGLHADLVAMADRDAKRRWGVAAYGLAGWQASRRAGPIRFRVNCDGEALEFIGTMVQILNCGSVFYPAWAFAPDVSPIDGTLDVVGYRARSLGEYARTAAHVVMGRPTDTDLVLHRRARRVRLDAEPEVRLQLDGELAGRSPGELTIEPRALPVLVPAGSPWTAPR